jgi:hypothetical protein
VSIDAPFVRGESAKLVFNFTSVQAYELMIVLVALFLAHRRLWYDSTLLAGLENLLVFVPFILISQAALTDVHLTQAMCSLGMLLAVLRFGALKRFFAALNLPGRLLGAGAALLVVNMTLPLIYSHLEADKYGTHLESGPAYEMNQYAWLLILPAVLALANLLPRAQAKGDLLPQHRWLPAGLFALWISVTGVHLYALDYVFDYYIRPDLFAPAVWVLAWTLYLRCPRAWPRLKLALAVPAALAPFFAYSSRALTVYLALTALNLAAYGALAGFHRWNRLAPHLAYASLLMLIAALPDGWLRLPLGSQDWASHFNFNSASLVTAAVALYFIFWTAWLRSAKLAIFGAGTMVALILGLIGDEPNDIYWAVQAGLVFLLLHSLRWNDAAETGASKVRVLLAAAWVLESFLWMQSGVGRFWMPFIPGAFVLVVYAVSLPGRGIWRHWVVPAAAAAVVLSGPCSALVDGVRSAPAGLLAVAGSFLFLLLGTVAALTRDVWHKHD